MSTLQGAGQDTALQELSRNGLRPMEELKFGDLLVLHDDPERVVVFLQISGRSAAFMTDIYDAVCVQAPKGASWQIGTHVRILADGWVKKEAQQ